MLPARLVSAVDPPVRQVLQEAQELPGQQALAQPVRKEQPGQLVALAQPVQPGLMESRAILAQPDRLDLSVLPAQPALAHKDLQDKMELQE